MNVTTGNEWVAWVERGLGMPMGDAVAFGIADGDRPLGAVVFNNYRPGSIEASVYSVSPRWCNRAFLSGVFAYAFETARVRRIQASTRKKDKKTRNFLLRLGFRLEGVARRAHETGADLAVYSLLKSECKWLKNGQKIEFATTGS